MKEAGHVTELENTKVITGGKDRQGRIIAVIKPKTQLLENTSILTHAENRYKLSIKEALLILEKAPIINRQHENFCNILKLHKSRNISSNNNSNNICTPV